MEFHELLTMSRIMASQWVTWFHVVVWVMVLTVMTVARDIVRNSVKRENWLKVRDIVLAHGQ